MECERRRPQPAVVVLGALNSGVSQMGIIPVLESQVADLRRLADEAQDPFLAGLLRAQATYEDAFATRLPIYQPSDRALWMAAYDFSGAVRAACKTVQPR